MDAVSLAFTRKFSTFFSKNWVHTVLASVLYLIKYRMDKEYLDNDAPLVGNFDKLHSALHTNLAMELFIRYFNA